MKTNHSTQYNKCDEKQAEAELEFLTTSLLKDTVPLTVGEVANESDLPSDFDKAIEATEYGLFNYLFLVANFYAAWANTFDTTTMSYILSSAQCDLDLTLNQKGMLNSISFVGIIAAGFFWGFLADTRGRRSLLIFGYLASSICNILSSTSQSFYPILILKFFSGCVISGPLAISTTYCAEFHSAKYRSATLYWMSVFTAVGNVVLPALAWAIIPQSWSFTMFNGAFVYNSWRIFLFVCSTPAFVAFLLLFYFPESPKYLMTQGRNDEALKVFQKMYAMNTGKPPESYPIKSLSPSGRQKKIKPFVGQSTFTIWQKTKDALSNIKPLFVKPYLSRMILVALLQFSSFLCLNTLRLWMPLLFTFTENFNYENRDPDLGAPALCEMIAILTISANSSSSFIGGNSSSATPCVVPPIQPKVYINLMIIWSTTMVGFVLVGTLVDLIGKKNVLLMTFALPAVCLVALNWSRNSNVTLGILTIYITLTSIAAITVTTFIVDLMPTSLRSMAVSLATSIGRGGATTGNVLFPILLSIGCLAPFIFVGGFLIFCLLLTLCIPKPPAKLL